MKQFLGDIPVKFGIFDPYKIKHSEAVEATAEAAIGFGESVYVLDNKIFLAPSGKFTNLPFGAKIGFTLNSTVQGGPLKVKTIGVIKADYNVGSTLSAQDVLIARINEALGGV